MNEIKKSYLSCLWYAIWSVILIWIPLLIRFVKIKSRRYAFDEKNLYIEEGVFKKVSLSVPLIKVETISAETNIFGNGKVKIDHKAQGVTKEEFNAIEFIKNSRQVQRDLMKAVDLARDNQGVKPIDTF